MLLTAFQVFSVLFTESAGTNALNGLNPMTDYNTNLSMVKYNEYVHTQVRRFIVVKRKRGFCFAVYGNAILSASKVANVWQSDLHLLRESHHKERSGS
jgi:hypothetical protein